MGVVTLGVADGAVAHGATRRAQAALPQEHITAAGANNE